MCHTSCDEAVALVAHCGQGALLGKGVIKSAFKLFQSFLVISSCEVLPLGDIYVDTVLTVESSISCAAFEKFSTFLERAFKLRTGKSSVMNYLNYFLIVGRPGSLEYKVFMVTDPDEETCVSQNLMLYFKKCKL